MEERIEVIEMLVMRWNTYYRALNFYKKIANDFSCADKFINKYKALINELTNIIADIKHTVFEDVFNKLEYDYINKKLKEMEENNNESKTN